ncbi:autotransporter outer membrane beta-barrel domain-containing protein [Polycladidibacter hongkongensis]|uniref:autotransporter family protein n=1 Tax=Polycladidibacter hongkongensis TaxID=1647556 RepID=UPI00155EF820|nr:autotransporter outer membrane beta-barrel domain-containing protein [Pseudovibrio hongkongensis]
MTDFNESIVFLENFNISPGQSVNVTIDAGAVFNVDDDLSRAVSLDQENGNGSAGNLITYSVDHFGSITTGAGGSSSDFSQHGIYVSRDDATFSAIDVDLRNGSSVTTNRRSGYGVFVETAEDGLIDVDFHSGSTVTTNGDRSHGIWVFEVGNDSTANIDNAGTITTAGDEAYGMRLISRGDRAVYNITNAAAGVVNSADNAVNTELQAMDDGAFNFTNEGSLTSTGNAAVFVDMLYSDDHTSTYDNSGSITGATRGVHINLESSGILIPDNNRITFNNSGTLNGGSGEALFVEGAVDDSIAGSSRITVNLNGGSRVTGDLEISDGLAPDFLAVLNLNMNAGDFFRGAAINFDQINVAGNGDWDITSATNLPTYEQAGATVNTSDSFTTQTFNQTGGTFNVTDGSFTLESGGSGMSLAGANSFNLRPDAGATVTATFENTTNNNINLIGSAGGSCNANVTIRDGFGFSAGAFTFANTANLSSRLTYELTSGQVGTLDLGSVNASGFDSIELSGAGTWRPSADQTLDTTINQSNGTLDIVSGRSFSTPSLNLSGGTIELAGTLNDGDLQASPQVTISGGTLNVPSGGSLTMVEGGNGRLSMSSGQITANGTLTADQVDLSGGTVEVALGTANDTPAEAPFQVNNSASISGSTVLNLTEGSGFALTETYYIFGLASGASGTGEFASINIANPEFSESQISVFGDTSSGGDGGVSVRPSFNPSSCYAFSSQDNATRARMWDTQGHVEGHGTVHHHNRGDWVSWGDVSGQLIKAENTSKTPGYDAQNWGFTAGTDYEFAQGLRTGGYVGYLNSHAVSNDPKCRGSREKSDTYISGLYATMEYAGVLLMGQAEYAYQDVDFTGLTGLNFTDTTQAGYGVQSINSLVSATKDFQAGEFLITPQVAGLYRQVFTDSYTRFASNANLNSDFSGTSQGLFDLIGGMRVSRSFSLGDDAKAIGWVAGYGRQRLMGRDISNVVVDTSATSHSNSVETEHYSFLVDAGVGVHVNRQLELTASFEGDYAATHASSSFHFGGSYLF